MIFELIPPQLVVRLFNEPVFEPQSGEPETSRRMACAVTATEYPHRGMSLGSQQSGLTQVARCFWLDLYPALMLGQPEIGQVRRAISEPEPLRFVIEFHGQ